MPACNRGAATHTLNPSTHLCPAVEDQRQPSIGILSRRRHDFGGATAAEEASVPCRGQQALNTASVQVNDFFGRCNLITTGANRTIETDAIVDLGESRLRTCR